MIAQCTLRLADFVPKASQLYTRMVVQGGNKASILCKIKTTFQRYLEAFSEYCKTYDETIDRIIMY